MAVSITEDDNLFTSRPLVEMKVCVSVVASRGPVDVPEVDISFGQGDSDPKCLENGARRGVEFPQNLLDCHIVSDQDGKTSLCEFLSFRAV